MQKNRLRRALDGDLPAALGCLVLLEGGATARVMAHAGYDFLMVDVQHGSFQASDFVAVVDACRGHDVAIVARVSPGRPDQIEWALDMGAHGVMVPLVNSAADAERAVAACRYPPRGRRSVGGVRNLLQRGQDYVAEADDDVVCLIQIEHVDGVENLDEILAVPGIDGVTPGHVDLARSLGHVADYSSGIGFAAMPAEVQKALRQVDDACARHGVPVLPVAGALAEVEGAVANGVRVLFYSSDYHELTKAARDGVERCRSLLGTKPST